MPASDFLDEELSMCSSHDILSLKWKKKKKKGDWKNMALEWRARSSYPLSLSNRYQSVVENKIFLHFKNHSFVWEIKMTYVLQNEEIIEFQ